MPAGRPSSAPAGRASSRPALRMPRTDSGRPVLSARAGAVLGVLVILVAILAIPIKEWITQQARIAELESEVAWHTDHLATLTQQMKQWDDPAYVEAQARARLKFVKPGEVGYVVIDGTPAQEQEKRTTTTLVAAPTGVAWWSAVWSTVEKVADPKAAGIQESAPAPAAPAQSYGQ